MESEWNTGTCARGAEAYEDPYERPLSHRTGREPASHDTRELVIPARPPLGSPIARIRDSNRDLADQGEVLMSQGDRNRNQPIIAPDDNKSHRAPIMGERYESGSAVRLESVTSHVGVPFAAKGKRGRRGRQAEGTSGDVLPLAQTGRASLLCTQENDRTPVEVPSATHHSVRSSGQRLNEKERGDAEGRVVKMMGGRREAKFDSGTRGGHIRDTTNQGPEQNEGDRLHQYHPEQEPRGPKRPRSRAI
ncbi:hypothetical protein DFP72DRAFT_861435 [Ephemerocybe angulata]|uniref:Uncharacterized protein n=1 Tax=Ephemerocybe angulata TaxID=980116 RepID=A0A8H6H7G4_9AGAR|nr:hypothetical protein DFP72DRAFT_861435 [Tulosesus angulatus]